MLGAPTASGKSAAALQLAERFPLELVNADAMQVYQGMDIGTAKATVEERARVPHHLIDLVTPEESFSVADWVVRAEGVITEVLRRGRLPLVVGGTGFYLRALSQGLPTVPPADPAVQVELWRELEEHGLDALEQELAASSPQDVLRSQRNPRRLVRALEILRRTGRSPRDFPTRQPVYRYSMAVLEPAMAVLRPRIEARCNSMFEAGLIDEVEQLLARYPQQLTAMQAIGYKEVVQALAGRVSMESAREEVLSATTRYARRQLTWFRRQQADIREALLASKALRPLGSWLEGLAGSPRED
ncbi:MAG: tRNA (adenosine(37)-N6)-dimethylallyltransferase MiaA [Trueperaceae bacterium]